MEEDVLEKYKVEEAKKDAYKGREQTWSCHQVTPLNELNRVAGDALEEPETKFARWTNGRIERHQRRSHERLQEYQQGVRQVVREEEVERPVGKGTKVGGVFMSTENHNHFPLVEGSHYQNLFTTSTSGASESSSEIQQLRQERDHLNVHGRNLETEPPACQSMHLLRKNGEETVGPQFFIAQRTVCSGTTVCRLEEQKKKTAIKDVRHGKNDE